MNTYLSTFRHRHRFACRRQHYSLSLSQVTDTFVSSQLDNISWPEQHPHLTTGA